MFGRQWAKAQAKVIDYNSRADNLTAENRFTHHCRDQAAVPKVPRDYEHDTGNRIKTEVRWREQPCDHRNDAELHDDCREGDHRVPLNSADEAWRHRLHSAGRPRFFRGPLCRQKHLPTLPIDNARFCDPPRLSKHATPRGMRCRITR